MATYKGIEYEIPDYSDVPEPTEAELAEVDAAMAAALDGSPVYVVQEATAWLKTQPVQAALAAVGPPIATDSWTPDFAEHLLGYVDARQELGIDHMLEALAAWNFTLRSKLGATGEKGLANQRDTLAALPAEIPKLLLTTPIQGRTMDFEHAAWLLQVTEDELERIMWRHPARLHELAQRVMDGESIESVSKTFGCGPTTLNQFLKIRYGFSRGRGRPEAMEEITVAACLRLVEEEGWSCRKAYDYAIAQGWLRPTFAYGSFTRRMARARREAA